VQYSLAVTELKLMPGFDESDSVASMMLHFVCR